MVPLRTENGRLYVVGIRGIRKKLEVEATPIFPGLEAEIGFTGPAPDFEHVLVDIICDIYEKEKFSLFDANAYRLFIVGEIKAPEMRVADGIVPAETKRKVVLDFYKVQPKK